jgi:flagellar motor protein MotB
MKKLILLVLLLLPLRVTVAHAADTSETIFILSDDLKSAVSYYNKRNPNFGNPSFLFSEGFDQNMIMYARPENYSWNKEDYKGDNYECLRFPGTNTYAYLQSHIATKKFLEKTGPSRYRLFVDGSQCMGDGCSQDENIVVAVIPRRFKVVNYEATVKGSWKVVGNTYTFYSRNVGGASINIDFEDLAPVVYNDLTRVLTRFKEILITYDGTNVKVTMPVEGMFTSGQAEIRDAGKEWLNAFASTLKKSAFKELRVEGHSDNVPIAKSKQNVFPSNWELSAARAASVVRHFEELNLDPKRLAAVGYAYSRPVADNTTPEGRMKNRRIEFTIVPAQETGSNKTYKAQWDAF